MASSFGKYSARAFSKVYSICLLFWFKKFCLLNISSISCCNKPKVTGLAGSIGRSILIFFGSSKKMSFLERFFILVFCFFGPIFEESLFFLGVFLFEMFFFIFKRRLFAGIFPMFPWRIFPRKIFECLVSLFVLSLRKSHLKKQY